MSLVAKMKEQYSKGGGVTPEQHRLLQKTAKEKEEEAVRIAKARAARYNITLRSTQLQVAKVEKMAPKAPSYDPSKLVKGTTTDDYKSKAEATAAGGGSKVSYGGVALKKVERKKTVVADSVADALHHDRAPSIAVAVVQAAAVAPSVEDAPAEPPAAAAAAEPAPMAPAAPAAEPEEVKEFEMDKLKAAVASGDEGAINQAIVTEFLEVHAPEKVSEVPQMMEEFKGNEQQLMENLVKEHPDPALEIEQRVAAEVKAETATEEKATAAESEEVKAAVEEVHAQDEELKEKLEELVDAAAVEAKSGDAETRGSRLDSQFIFAAQTNPEGNWVVNPETVPE